MLDPDIDVPFERNYVPPSIQELKRGQKDSHGGMSWTRLQGRKKMSISTESCRIVMGIRLIQFTSKAIRVVGKRRFQQSSFLIGVKPIQKVVQVLRNKERPLPARRRQNQ
ncbi:hypothetical protein DPMN_074815 [Dreissena polymorpha]|uniref:Uncharacterized protein n=1 Tax=Dreissena polymorpha TaxID=45954 RepID=A0A9D3YKJ0_DREPO|nr:hypothetical protein DPMN_074815 [Dreissena polymorpha]